MTKEVWTRSVECWRSIFGQHKWETKGFSLDLCELTDDELTDDELTNLKPVTNNFLGFAPAMFQVYLPKHHAGLRRAIAYLSDLQHRQAGAWERQIAKWEKETTALETLIERLPVMTKEQRIKAINEHFGWD